MTNVQMLIWLFSLLFMFHDFEEIIFMKAWISKNKGFLKNRFPRLSKKLIPHFEMITTSSFALGVAEEFILISMITVVADWLNWYDLWMGSFIAFTFHLFVHCVQAFIVRRFIPCIVTSVICLPICLYIIKQMIHVSTVHNIVVYSILCLIIMVINVGALHKGMALFSKWIIQYEHQSQKT